MRLSGKSKIYGLLIYLIVFVLFSFRIQASTMKMEDPRVLLISSYSPIKEEGNRMITSFERECGCSGVGRVYGLGSVTDL